MQPFVDDRKTTPATTSPFWAGHDAARETDGAWQKIASGWLLANPNVGASVGACAEIVLPP